jgi:hypothetical protein
LHRKALLPFLKPELAPNPILLVILMIVKEASYLPLQWRRSLRITDGTGAVEELPLELRGNSIPAHKHGRAQALQNLVFFLSEGSTILAILSALSRLIEMNQQFASMPQVQARRSLGPGLSAAAVTDFAIGNHRGCSGEIRVEHLFRQRGALDRREDPVHSAFFPIPVVVAARSSRAPIWTAAGAANGRAQHSPWPCARTKIVARTVAEQRDDRAQAPAAASLPPHPWCQRGRP